MKRIHLLSTGALGLALLAAGPAAAQRGGGMDGGGAPLSSAAVQNRGAAEADRMHKGNGTNGGPAELLRMAQAVMRRGQTVQANELLERAETRLLTAGGSAEPAARRVSDARRALLDRDRAEAMRHTNMAIAAVRDGGGTATGSDAGGVSRGAEGGGGPGIVDSGMGTIPTGAAARAVVRDSGTGGVSISRAEGVVLAQSNTTGTGARGGARGNAPAGLPPGDTIPGWSGPRSGAQGGGRTGGANQPGVPNQDFMPDSFSRGGQPAPTFSSPLSGPSSSGITGGEPARVGGAPPSDTSRAPGSSGSIGPSGPMGLGVGGPLR